MPGTALPLLGHGCPAQGIDASGSGTRRRAEAPRPPKNHQSLRRENFLDNAPRDVLDSRFRFDWMRRAKSPPCTAPPQPHVESPRSSTAPPARPTCRRCRRIGPRSPIPLGKDFFRIGKRARCRTPPMVQWKTGRSRPPGIRSPGGPWRRPSGVRWDLIGTVGGTPWNELNARRQAATRCSGWRPPGFPGGVPPEKTTPRTLRATACVCCKHWNLRAAERCSTRPAAHLQAAGLLLPPGRDPRSAPFD